MKVTYDKNSIVNDAEEWCFFMFKPGYNDAKTGIEVLDKLADAGAKIYAIKHMWLSKKACREHYAHIVNLYDEKGDPIYPRLEEYMLSEPVTGCWLYGDKGLVENLRKLMGSTKNPAPGTLRAEYTKRFPKEERTTKNGFHCSDSQVNADIEIQRFFFRDKELGIQTLSIYEFEKGIDPEK